MKSRLHSWQWEVLHGKQFPLKEKLGSKPKPGEQETHHIILTLQFKQFKSLHGRHKVPSDPNGLKHDWHANFESRQEVQFDSLHA